MGGAVTLFPGAIWRPIPVSSTRPKRRKGRGVGFHVAASEAASLFSFFSSSPNDSHLYVRRDGTVEQYVDLDLVSYAGIDGNPTMIWVETQGGVTSPDGEPWTPQQVETNARIARWAHDSEGAPLTLMPDSRPTSRGIGHHRLGIDPWRVAGGEVWSSSRGKLCPGAAKIAQLPQILDLALNGDDMPTADEVAAAVWGYRIQHGGVDAPATVVAADTLTIGQQSAPKLDALAHQVGDVHGKVVDSVFDLSGRPGPDADDLLGHILSTRAEVADLAAKVAKVQAPAVDAAKLAAALLSDDAAVAKLGEAIAAGLASRVHNG